MVYSWMFIYLDPIFFRSLSYLTLTRTVTFRIYLGMIANASEGATRRQILNTLGTTDLETLNLLCEKIMHYLPCDKTDQASA